MADIKTTPTIDANVFTNQADNPLDPNHTLTLTFSHGRTISLQVGDLSHTVLTQALMHGLKQKLVDAAAIARNQETGKSATVADKYEAVKAVADRLVAGAWNMPRAEGTGAGGLLLRAMVQHTGKTHEDIKTFLDGLTPEQQNALRRNPKIAAIIATLKPEAKPNPAIDSDALLDAASR